MVTKIFDIYKKGGSIDIDPKNKGKFTKTKKITGKSTEQLTHSKNKLTKKRAQFAENSKDWKHKLGGVLEILNKFMSGGEIKKARKKPGGSNVGKKKFANGKKRTGPYAGPSGGSPEGSYPIPDEAHGRAALRLAGHAPNPAGIRAKVYKKYPQLKKK
jgi:hypothetical protein